MTASRGASPGPVRRRRVLLLALVVGALLLGTAPAALAHDGLVGTSPAAGAGVPTAPSAVQLDFTGEPLPLGTQVAVVGPDGRSVSEGEPEIRGRSVVQALAGDLPAGSYRVDWRSTSSDGHSLSGTFDFSVAAATATPTAPASVVPSPESAAPSPAAVAEDVAPASAGTPLAGVWVAVGAVVLVGLVVLLVSRQRRRG